MYDDEVKYNNINIYYKGKYLQNNCATKVDEKGEYDYPHRGTCGAGCPREYPTPGNVSEGIRMSYLKRSSF